MAIRGQSVGYRRVSTEDQNTARQLEGIELDECFEDHASGKDVKRPQLEALLRHVRRGDVVLCHSMDRMARNLGDLRRLVSDMTRRGVHVRFIKEGLTFTGEDSPMANFLLSLLGAVAEFERALIGERQREGIALAKRNGVYRGASVHCLRSRLPSGGLGSTAASARLRWPDTSPSVGRRSMPISELAKPAKARRGYERPSTGHA